jgi:hypothetical protein
MKGSALFSAMIWTGMTVACVNNKAYDLAILCGLVSVGALQEGIGFDPQTMTFSGARPQ